MLLERPQIDVPDYVPAEIRANIVGQTFSIKLPQNVRARMRTPEKISVADHVEGSRAVTDGPHDDKWRSELAPQSVKIMNTFSLPYVREINFCGVEQGAKTATMLNCIHWAVDVAPDDIFYAMPTEDTSNKIIGDKLIPMLQQSPKLKKYIPARQDDVGLKKIKLKHGVTIRPAHANSPSSMASFPAKYIFGDEVDKFPDQAGKEASPIVLLRKRTRLYRGRWKCFFSSTPAQGYIYSATMACAQVWQYQNCCPHCQSFVKFEGEHLRVPEDIPPNEYDESTDIYLACPACGVELNRAERELSVRSAAWICIKGGDVIRPATVGFHQPAWACADIPLYEIAAFWQKAQNSSALADKVAWANGYETKDYVHEQKDREEDYILRLVDSHQPRGVVPENTWGLIIKADTQQVGFFYQIWAVGWGQELSVVMIDHGKVGSFSNLEDKRKKPYLDADGKEFLCKGGFIDSGGGTNPARPKHTRTREVYDFCRKNKFWKPLKGRRTMDNSWDVKRRDFYPASVGKKVPIPGGLLLYNINVTFYKNELDNKLQIERTDPGAITLHAEVGLDFAKQMCVEYQDERGYWICPKGKHNHHWDIMVYGLALCDIMGIRDKRKKKKRAAAAKPKRGSGFVTNF